MPLTFWNTTWAHLDPGDVVLAPGDVEWTLRACIGSDAATEYLIQRGAESVWTAQADDTPVRAARPTDEDAGDPAAALAVLTLAGLRPVRLS